MNSLLRPRNWEPACGTERSAASANNMAVLLSEPEAVSPRVLVPATYHLGTPRNQHPAVARWPARLA
jgi:hypothetical protein